MRTLLCAIVCLYSGFAIGQNVNDCMLLSHTGNYETAERCFKANSQAKPGDFMLNYARFKNQIELGLEKGSLTEAQQSLSALGTANQFGLVAQVRMMLAEGKTSEARNMAESIRPTVKKENAEVLVELADAFINTKTPSLAFADTLLNQAKSFMKTESTSYLFAKGMLFTAQGDHGSALNTYNLILDREPKNAFAHYLKGTSYHHIQSLPAALDELKLALNLYPVFPPATLEYAEVLFESGNVEEGKKQYENYFGMKPNDLYSRIRYGSSLFGAKQFSEALVQADKILVMSPDNISGLKLKAYCNYELGSIPEGIASLDRYFQLADTSVTVFKDYEYLGRLHQKSGNDSLAVINFAKAAEKPGAKADFYSEMLTYFMKKGKYNEVIALYNKKGTLFTTTSADAYNCGRAYLAITNYAAADSMFMRVTELQPAWPNGFLMRGNANANLDPGSKEGRAKPYYEQYLTLAEADTVNSAKLKSGMIEANKYLGYYYYLNKDIEKSKAYWKKVLLLEPTDKQALEVLKQL